MDYAQLVLYWNKRSPVASELHKSLLSYSEVILQDVGEIPIAQRPPWLTGVPIVVELPEYRIHTGTNAVQFVHKWISNRSAQVQASPSMLPGSQIPGTPIDASSLLPTIHEGERYTDQKPPLERTLDDIVRCRTQQQKQVATTSHSPSSEA